MKGSERDSEQVVAKEIKSRSHLAGMYLKEPLHSIVGWIRELGGDLFLTNERITKLEKKMKKFEKGIEAFDEKMKRIEKYAK